MTKAHCCFRGGSSGMTYSSAVVPSPSPPPPQYSASLQLASSSADTYLTHHQAPSNANLSPQRLQSNRACSSSFPHSNSGLPTNQITSNLQFVESYNEPLQEECMVQHQRRGPIYRRGPTSHSSRSSSCSSSRDYRVPRSPRRQDYGEIASQDNFNAPPFSGPGNRSLNGVIENDVNPGEERQQNRNICSQGSNLPQPVYATPKNRLPFPPPPPVNSPGNALQSSLSPRTNKAESFEASAGSAKAVSCDSGLPAEETDLNVGDPNAPLLQRPPIAQKTLMRGGPGRILT